MFAPTFLCSMRECQGELFCNNSSKTSDFGITRKILRSRGHTFPTQSSVEDELSRLRHSLKGTAATLQSGPSPSGGFRPAVIPNPLSRERASLKAAVVGFGQMNKQEGGTASYRWNAWGDLAFTSPGPCSCTPSLPGSRVCLVVGRNYSRIWLSCHGGSAYQTNCSEGGK